MESTEVTAKTLEEALEIALKQLGAERDEVEVEVVSRGKTGFLGFGSEMARVRVTHLAEAGSLAQKAKAVVDKLLGTMELSVASTIRRPHPDTPDTYTVEVEGDDSGLLIGRRGETLRTFQFVMNLILSRQGSLEPGRVVLDVEGYRRRRSQALQGLALRLAERVATTGRPMTLEPMAANERRIIHVSLADHPRVTTQSTGEGNSRQVSILPRRSGGHDAAPSDPVDTSDTPDGRDPRPGSG